MSEDEIRIENPDESVDFPEKIIEFNEQNQQRLKTLTLDLMLSILSTSLAELKAGNNSEKLKNETRQ